MEPCNDTRERSLDRRDACYHGRTNMMDLSGSREDDVDVPVSVGWARPWTMKRGGVSLDGLHVYLDVPRDARRRRSPGGFFLRNVAAHILINLARYWNCRIVVLCAQVDLDLWRTSQFSFLVPLL